MKKAFNREAPIRFDFEDFTKNITKAHRIATERYGTDALFSLEETSEVLYYFFWKYEQERHVPHPRIRTDQLVEILRKMPGIWIDSVHFTPFKSYVEPEEYPEMIDSYFETWYNESCDYNINHFFSDGVWAVRYLNVFGLRGC